MAGTGGYDLIMQAKSFDTQSAIECIFPWWSSRFGDVGYIVRLVVYRS